jgi:tRNA nucleotidyltransferase (CCA-adding enzyme)
MKTYLVGGAVRDRLLGLPVGERDWVVVGATPDDLEGLGFRRVGRDFPVFLHPGTAEEHALARTERKTGPGHRGFVTRHSPDVTLAEDLGRRDLTINAIAEDPATGELIDPYGGGRDIESRCLRHIGPAFAEDPLRVLRVARFAARFGVLGFSVSRETLELMRAMTRAGELETLVPERVWQETRLALAAARPRAYFETLRECGALVQVFPEIEALYGVPQPPKWHPEIDTGVHTMMVLDQASRLSPDPVTRFAALTHDLGKGTTPPTEWPRHVGHEMRSVELLGRMCERLRIPNQYRDLATLVARHHGVVHRALNLRHTTVLDLLEQADALRRPERFEQFLTACEADMRGRTGFETEPYPQGDLLRTAQHAVASATVRDDELARLDGPAIAARYRKARLAALAAVREHS